MAATRTPGITLDARGDLIIDKEYHGARLFRRLGRVSQEEAETVLRGEMLRLESELDLRMHARPLFRHCAARYLAESAHKRTAHTIAYHVKLLLGHFSDFEPGRIHDGTLRPFIELRQAEGVGSTTINRSLEVMRTILHRAARAIAMTMAVPGLSGQLRWSQCWRNRLARRAPLRGKNRTHCFSDCRPTSSAWRSSQ